MRNGYTYIIDTVGRTREVEGALDFNPDQKRSRAEQASAGRADRLPTDDGGHYIAKRFNGPTEAFNHFAQNSNFNRGAYRVLEDQWAREKRQGKRVTVDIVPGYSGGSQRPSSIRVTYVVDGKSARRPFSNAPGGKPHGK